MAGRSGAMPNLGLLARPIDWDATIKVMAASDADRAASSHCTRRGPEGISHRRAVGAAVRTVMKHRCRQPQAPGAALAGRTRPWMVASPTSQDGSKRSPKVCRRIGSRGGMFSISPALQGSSTVMTFSSV